MTKTALLIIAIMILAILIMFIANINLYTLNRQLIEKLTSKEFELMDLKDEFEDINNDLKLEKTLSCTVINHRDYLIKEKEKTQSVIDSLPKDIKSYIQKEINQ